MTDSNAASVAQDVTARYVRRSGGTARFCGSDCSTVEVMPLAEPRPRACTTGLPCQRAGAMPHSGDRLHASYRTARPITVCRAAAASREAAYGRTGRDAAHDPKSAARPPTRHGRDAALDCVREKDRNRPDACAVDRSRPRMITAPKQKGTSWARSNIVTYLIAQGGPTASAEPSPA